MKKFLVLLALVVVELPLLVLAADKGSVPFLMQDSTKLTFYGDVVKASDGGDYRVTATIVEMPNDEPRLILDAYSTNGRYVKVLINRPQHGKDTVQRAYACTAAQFKTEEKYCPLDEYSKALLAELTVKTMRRENAIGNHELLWSWDLGTKELRTQVGEK